MSNDNHANCETQINPPARLVARAMKDEQRRSHCTMNDRQATSNIQNHQDYDELKNDLVDLFNNCEVE